MGKFDGILICTDLDGTLLKNDKTISKNNLDAIEYFKKEGGYFTFITGRMPSCAVGLNKIIKANAPVGCINGGGVYDFSTDSYLWTKQTADSVMELVEYVDKNMQGIGIQVNTFEKIFFSVDNPAMEEFRKATKVPNLVRHYNDITEPVAKIVFGVTNEKSMNDLIHLLNSHPKASEFDFIRSEKTLYEILPKGINKGAALLKFVEILGLDSSKTISIGDYNNDISMIKAAKVGVAVSNAVDELKEVCDYITVSNEEDAIEKIIFDIEKGIIAV